MLEFIHSYIDARDHWVKLHGEDEVVCHVVILIIQLVLDKSVTDDLVSPRWFLIEGRVYLSLLKKAGEQIVIFG